LLHRDGRSAAKKAIHQFISKPKQRNSMETKTYKNWWFLTTNGVISILFGLLMVFCTTEFLLGIFLYLGIAMLSAGVLLFIASVYNLKKDKKVGMILFQSIATITIGLVIIIAPKADILRVFLLLIGVWAITVGVFQIAVLVNIGKSLANKNVILFNGLLTIALGLFLCLKPFEFATLLAHIMGALAILFGVIMIYLSVLLRKVSVIRGKEDEPHVL
jgi:uncharacterized membrane protein HdeD (DUF308 family)